jgi:hypothetical protein
LFIRHLSLSLIIVAGQGYTAAAQSKPAEAYQIKAAFLYNFTRFVEWPDNAFSSPDEPFVIGILGNERMGDYLEAIIKGEKIGNRPIKVQLYKSLGELGNCNILFLNSAEAARIRERLAELNRKGILTVSDEDSFLRWGGMVRFFTDQNKIKIEINVNSARSGHLQISSKLLGVAAIYKSDL